MKDVGLYNETVKIYEVTLNTYQTSYDWAEKNVPVYYNKAKESLGPIADHTADFVAKSYVKVQETGIYLVDKVFI